MNVQERLIALHHLDAPWRPCDIEQREGRILRQGNRWPEVWVYQYVTEGSFDSYLWQLLENKARFISQVMAGEISQRTADDVAEVVLSAAEIKALASGNPKVVQKVQLDAELGRLERVRSVWLNGRLAGQHELERNTLRLAELANDITALQQAIAVRDRQRGTFALTIITPKGSTTTYTERAVAGKVLRQTMRAWLAHDLTATADRRISPVRRIGVYQGLHLELRVPWFRSEPSEPELSIVLDDDGRRHTLAQAKGDSDSGIVASLDHHIRKLEEQVAARQRTQRELEQRQAELSASIARPWDGIATYGRLRRELQRLNAELSGGDTPLVADDADAEMDALLAEARALTAEAATPADTAVVLPAMDQGVGEHPIDGEPTAVGAMPLAPLVDSQVTTAPQPPIPADTNLPTTMLTFDDLAWMVARPARRKPAASRVPAEQLRLFE
jgi:hypothetical protein